MQRPCAEWGFVALVASSAIGASSSAEARTSQSSQLAPKLVRKATPAQRFTQDDAACKAGDKKACVALAHRFSGTGIEAGCGLPRERPFPSLKRVPSDDEADWKGYRAALRKACELGDEPSCKLAKAKRGTSADDPRHVRYAGVRRDPSELGIWAYASALKPEWQKALADAQKKCSDAGQCHFGDLLFKKQKAPSDGKLTAELAKVAVDACDKTHDCDDIYMMLDKDGYTPDELATVRAAFAKSLTNGCMEGECTCGEATKYLPETDESRSDLAILGCQNGEAEGCFAMARLFEEGKIGDKDPVRADELYDVACPPIHPTSTSDVSLGDYSPHACDHFAEIYLGGPYPGNDRERGIYYAEIACRSPGSEFDNAPCVRRGMQSATKRTSTGHNGDDARFAAWGDSDPLSVDNECSRPSVKEQCAEFKKALVNVK